MEKLTAVLIRRMPDLRYWVIWIALALMIAGVGTFSFLAHHAGVLPTHSEQFRGLADLLNRSPGQRGGVNELKGKAKIAKRKEVPSQRALGKIFDVAPENFIENVAVARQREVPVAIPDELIALPLTSIAALDGLASEFNTDTPPQGQIIPIIGTSAGGDFNGGGGLGADSPHDTPPLVTRVAAPVPEPETWVLLILGFALCGAILRRDKIVKLA